MNEENPPDAGKKLRFVPWMLVIPLALAAALYIFFATRPSKPLAQGVTVESLAVRTGNTDGTMLTLVRLEPDDSGGKEIYTAIEVPRYFKVYGSFVFSDLFSFDEWELTEEKPTGTILLAVRFGEQSVLELYEGGQAAAFDGYAGSNYKGYAYYNIPDHIVADLTGYLYAWGRLEDKNYGVFQHFDVF